MGLFVAFFSPVSVFSTPASLLQHFVLRKKNGIVYNYFLSFKSVRFLAQHSCQSLGCFLYLHSDVKDTQ